MAWGSRSKARSRWSATAAPFRGLKVKESQDRGAVGVLIYSDPADDGYMRGDVYPDGPMRPPSAIQRGSVQFLSIGPGDPSTPGMPSIAGAKRITRDQMQTVPKIPSLPISYGEAEKILRPPGRPACAGRMAGRAAVLVSRRARCRRRRDGRADGRRPQANLQRRRAHQGERGAGEARRCSAIIATHGRMAPSIPTREPRRCWNWRVATVRRSRAGGRRSERSSSRAGMPRSTALSDRPSGQRSTRRICSGTPWHISTAMSR